MNPELGNDNPVPEEAAEQSDNSEVAAPETSSADATPENGTDVSSDGENGSGSFWSGNPLDLEPENLAIYREMQSGLTSKTQELADLRRDLDSDRAKMQDQQSQLQQAWLALQAQSGQRQNGADDGAQETGPTVDELRQRFTEKAQNGDGFGALLEVMDARMKGLSGQPGEREQALLQEINQLKQQVSSVAETFAPHREASRLNTIFEDMKSGQYREFKDDRVKTQMRQILDTNDPTISSLLGMGTEESYRAALSLAGEKAIRAVNEGRLIDNAKRRAESAPPSSQSGTSSTPIGSTAMMSMDDILDKVLGQNPDLQGRFG